MNYLYDTKGMTGLSLAELAERYDAVVLDTGALDSDMSNRQARRKYRRDVRQVAWTGKLCTVDDAISEARVVFRGVDSLRVRVVSGEDFERGFFQGLINEILPIARGTGVLRAHKDFPLTDVKLAALALALRRRYETVAFASSDKPLLRMVGYLQTGGILDYPTEFRVGAGRYFFTRGSDRKFYPFSEMPVSVKRYPPNPPRRRE